MTAPGPMRLLRLDDDWGDVGGNSGGKRESILRVDECLARTSL